MDYFKKLPIYKKHIKKRKIKLLKNNDFFSALPFYEDLNAIKTNQVFRAYAMICKIEKI